MDTPWKPLGSPRGAVTPGDSNIRFYCKVVVPVAIVRWALSGSAFRLHYGATTSKGVSDFSGCTEREVAGEVPQYASISPDLNRSSPSLKPLHLKWKECARVGQSASQLDPEPVSCLNSACQSNGEPHLHALLPGRTDVARVEGIILGKEENGVCREAYGHTEIAWIAVVDPVVSARREGAALVRPASIPIFIKG